MSALEVAILQSNLYNNYIAKLPEKDDKYENDISHG
jgi:hypothetical protein